MSQVKLILLGILFLSIGNTVAWTPEVAPVDNETLNIGLSPALNQSSAEAPYLFGMDNEVMSEPFAMSSYLSNDPITICTQYMIYKQVWNGTHYVQIDLCNLTINQCVDLIYNPTKNAYELPSNWNQVTSNGFLVKRYFQNLINSDSEYCNQWNNTDEDDMPDIFYTYIDVDVDDGNEYWGYMHVALDADDERELTEGEIDFGFAMDGRGAGGGSGSIYEGINMYGTGAADESGMGAGFNTIFWCIIPLIFILSIMKLASRVMK